MKQFKGTGVALITPFNNDKSIDFNGLERLVAHCTEGGVDYLVVMGTTAENPVLSAAEKQQVLKAVQEANYAKKPIVYGIGGNHTEALAHSLQNDDLRGVDAILSVSPYYNKPTQEGIYNHYKLLSEASPLPLIIYNVPGRTGSNITAATTLRLAHDFKNIIGIKEASGDLIQVMEIIRDRPADFLVISGEDNLTLPIMACGGEGAISVSGQAFPGLYAPMVQAALNNNFPQARNLHYKLMAITEMLFAEGNPGGVKAALALQDICGETLRPPLWPISGALRQKIQSEMERQQL